MPTSFLNEVLGLARTRPRVFVAGVVVLCLAVSMIGFVGAALVGLPDTAEVRSVEAMARSTTILDVKGRHAFTLARQERFPVGLARVSPHMISAVIAIEDRRFYRHGGVDPVRVIGAAWTNLWAGRAAQGASTITQQLARLSFLEPEKTFRRKLQEVVLARRLERAFTKDEILELYLNAAYFGDGLYGVEAASRGYFDKHARDLGVAEAALLAGLLQAPSAYGPRMNAERALARRDVVLQVMHATGAIDRPAYESAVESPLELSDGLRREEGHGQYFKEEVRKQLVELFGWHRVYLDGLVVETSLDLDMQGAAETAVALAVRDIERRIAGQGGRRTAAPEALEAALVALDPETGEVRALVGGRSFERSPFNRATQARRQPGSAFKPFIYAAALERGYSPASVIDGLGDPVATAQGAWVPAEEHEEGDVITVREALRVSSNRAAVRTLQDVGIRDAVDLAGRMGMGSMPSVPSLALGSGEVTLLSLTAAFAAFADEGIVHQPTLIRRVTASSGEVLYQATPTRKPAVSPATAYLVTSMLEDVVNTGTASRSRQMGFARPAAGKTGTTDDYRDAWFVGYTPMLVAGVWVGYDRPRPIMRGGYAAELAVPMWTRFMVAATRKDAPAPFPVPDSVTAVGICRLSGKLATDDCRRHEGMTYTEYFRSGTEPDDWCLHPGFWRGLFGARAASLPEPAQAPAPPATTKRGFWTRLFGGSSRSPH